MKRRKANKKPTKLIIKPTNKFLNVLKDGMLLIVPLWATIAVLNWIWNVISDFLPNFARFFSEKWQSFPYFDQLVNLSFIIILLIAIFIAGFVVTSFFGRFFYDIFDKILSISPLIHPIYNGLKKMAEVLFGSQKEEDSIESKLTEAVMVPYPSADSWSFGFVTRTNAEHIFGKEKGADYITVYVPSSPIVSSGYYLLFKKTDVRPCSKDASQAMAVLLSAGSVQTSGDIKKVEGKKPKFGAIKKYFLNGLLFFTPMLATISLVTWAFNFVLSYVRTMRIIIPGYLNNIIPEAYYGLIANTGIILFLVLMIFLLGLIGESALGKAFQAGFNALTKRIPIFSTVYEAASSITDIFTKGPGENTFFSKAVLVPFPHDKVLAVGFVTHSDSAHIFEGGDNHVPVLLPTSPIPTTGWFINVERDKLTVLDMPVEQAIALVISLGITAGETDS
ncbi:MAG: DUF502 domain-containing protein [Brevinema sp.]